MLKFIQTFHANFTPSRKIFHFSDDRESEVWQKLFICNIYSSEKFFMRKSITQKDFFMTEKGKKIEVSSKAIVGFHTYSTLEHGTIFFVAEIY